MSYTWSSNCWLFHCKATALTTYPTRGQSVSAVIFVVKRDIQPGRLNCRPSISCLSCSYIYNSLTTRHHRRVHTVLRTVHTVLVSQETYQLSLCHWAPPVSVTLFSVSKHCVSTGSLLQLHPAPTCPPPIYRSPYAHSPPPPYVLGWLLATVNLWSIRQASPQTLGRSTVFSSSSASASLTGQIDSRLFYCWQ